MIPMTFWLRSRKDLCRKPRRGLAMRVPSHHGLQEATDVLEAGGSAAALRRRPVRAPTLGALPALRAARACAAGGGARASRLPERGARSARERLREGSGRTLGPELARGEDLLAVLVGELELDHAHVEPLA